jgi:hypothetical protein
VYTENTNIAAKTTLEPPKSATFTGMIISASYRSDIPAFHADWFARRLAAGFCQVRNPYGGKPYRVDLSVDAVDGFVFWTRNPRPFLPVLDGLAAAGRRFVLQVTVTGYPRLGSGDAEGCCGLTGAAPAGRQLRPGGARLAL